MKHTTFTERNEDGSFLRRVETVGNFSFIHEGADTFKVRINGSEHSFVLSFSNYGSAYQIFKTFIRDVTQVEEVE